MQKDKQSTSPSRVERSCCQQHGSAWLRGTLSHHSLHGFSSRDRAGTEQGQICGHQVLPRFCRGAKSWGHSPPSPSPLPALAALHPPMPTAPPSPGIAAAVTQVLHTPKPNFQAFTANSSSYISSRDSVRPDQQPQLKHSPCRCTPREYSLKRDQMYMSIYVHWCTLSHTHAHTYVFFPL